MPNKKISNRKREQIHTLEKRGVSIGGISKKLKISRPTVKKYSSSDRKP